MMQVTFGDLLDAAERHFDAAEQALGEIIRGEQAVRALNRLVLAAARIIDEHAPDPVEAAGGAAVTAWQHAAADLREAMLQAAEHIARADESLDGSARQRPDRCTRHLAHAAQALIGAQDLLRSHTTPGLGGVSADRSEWALLLTSRPLSSALTREMARWSCRAGALAHWLASGSGQVHGEAQDALAEAGTLLSAANDIIAPAVTADPGSALDRELLMGVPHASPPGRRVPRDPETPAELHAGIAISAARLRSAAFAMPADAATSAEISGPAWGRAATAAAIVSDIASLLLRTLAMRATRLTACPVEPRQLAAAAIGLADARNAWEQAAGLWQIMTTDTQSEISALTVETGDLAIRMGRLAFANPQWTPAKRHRAAPLLPEALAPDAGDLIAVLGAVHQAADALATMASSDLKAISAVWRARRLYMPQAILSGRRGPGSGYVTAPDDRVQLMQDLYRVIAATSRDAAQALGALVVESAVPSRAIALARTTGLTFSPQSPTGPKPTLETLRPRLRAFGKPRDWQVTRLDEIDADAVIRAYRDKHVGLRECAARFATSERLIAIILRDNDIPIRHDQPAPRPAEANQPRPPAASPAPQPDAPAKRQRCGPVERHMLALNVTDPGLLLRAAALDRASRELLAEGAASVSREDHPASKHEPERRRTARAPLVAASDTPPSPRAAVKQPADSLERVRTGSQGTQEINVEKRSPARRRALRGPLRAPDVARRTSIAGMPGEWTSALSS